MKKKTNLVKLIILFGTIALLLGGPLSAYAESDLPLTIRVRGLGVLPDDDSDTVAGGEATVDNSVGAEVDFTYFFTDNIASELVLGVAQHNVELRNSALDDLSGLAVLDDVDLGDVWLIPPTLTLQYHFLPDGKIRPYVGAGLNYTIFFEENEGTVVLDTDYDDSFGYALQLGADIGITENFAFNIDLKKLYLETEAEVTVPGAAVGGDAPATVKTDVDIDPWLLGFGIAYRF
ncbi:MAG TPA: OmpW family outer membrane protein [Desulfosalsimonadaceae bacterium]|nr:OmpW family outer membrane protein [Desulfosalsimonadaceae bacterium]